MRAGGLTRWWLVYKYVHAYRQVRHCFVCQKLFVGEFGSYDRGSDIITAVPSLTSECCFITLFSAYRLHLSVAGVRKVASLNCIVFARTTHKLIVVNDGV